LVIIGLAAAFIFGPHQRPQIDAAKVETHIVGDSAVSNPTPPLTREATP
jgi:hypothetical protein